MDACLTAVFGLEALLKIIAFSFTGYIRSNSNKVCMREVLAGRAMAGEQQLGTFALLLKSC